VIEKISGGGMASVYAIEYCGKKRAAKKFSKEYYTSAFYKEVCLLCSLHHSSIVQVISVELGFFFDLFFSKVYGWSEDSTNFWIIME